MGGNKQSTSEEGSKARNKKNSMTKTFCLLALFCLIIDIGIAKPSEQFLVEIDDIDEVDEVGTDYQEGDDKKDEQEDKKDDGWTTVVTDYEEGDDKKDEEEDKKDDGWTTVVTDYKGGDDKEEVEQDDKYVKKSFDHLDQDGSGTISLKEYVDESLWNRWKKLREKERMSKGNTQLRKYVEERTAWVKDLDKNGDGVVDFSEYCNWDSFYNKTEGDKEKQRKRTFNAMDWDDSGTLSMQEMVTIPLWKEWKKLPVKERENPKGRSNQLTKKLVESGMTNFKENDKNGDGVVEFNELFPKDWTTFRAGQ